ncbi:hypothetical protein C8F04DRAFT_1240790 [Mycena alexandri]|uniref:DUF6534 domain-containing protein n=1 Tax=Mycena alexandri TaxID=1745969 RepID=A0AAD6S777_9AGAR|nr:hypothetical protein C8F04DRAFT_1240790 [Mycena alexandri]
MAANGTSQLPSDVPLFNFQLMFAPLLFGVIMNALLFGVFIVQVHTYFRLYRTDFTWTRYIIYYLIVMETINTICDVGLIYEPLITLRNSQSVEIYSPKFLAAGAHSLRRVDIVIKSDLPRSSDPIVTTLISTPCQLFLAWRIRRVTKSNWLSGLVALLSFLSLVGGVGATIGVALNPEFAKFHLVEPEITLWLTSTAFADLFITAFLVNFLWSNKTGFKTQTDSVADKIIFFTVQTGTLTSFAAITDVTLFLLVPVSFLPRRLRSKPNIRVLEDNPDVHLVRTFEPLKFFMFCATGILNSSRDFSLSKLYSVCLVATLNAREEWNGLLEQMPSKNKMKDANAIIKIRRATDIQGLQLYIPSQFEFNSVSPRRRTPRSQWIPHPLPLATTKGAANRDAASETESARRTAEWAMVTGR